MKLKLLVIIFLLTLSAFSKADLQFPTRSVGSGTSSLVLLSDYNQSFPATTTAAHMKIANNVQVLVIDNTGSNNAIISLGTNFINAIENMTPSDTSAGATISEAGYTLLEPDQRVFLVVGTDSYIAWASDASTTDLTIRQGVYAQ